MRNHHHTAVEHLDRLSHGIDHLMGKERAGKGGWEGEGGRGGGGEFQMVKKTRNKRRNDAGNKTKTGGIT